MTAKQEDKHSWNEPKTLLHRGDGGGSQLRHCPQGRWEARRNEHERWYRFDSRSPITGRNSQDPHSSVNPISLYLEDESIGSELHQGSVYSCSLFLIRNEITVEEKLRLESSTPHYVIFLYKIVVHSSCRVNCRVLISGTGWYHASNHT
jgi:hypothetical protein